MPASLRPDIGNVAAPDLVRCIDHKLSIQMVGDVDALRRRLLVGMTARLLADDTQLFHQTAELEATYRDAIFCIMLMMLLPAELRLSINNS